MKTPVRLFSCQHLLNRATALLSLFFGAALHAPIHAAAPTFASPQIVSTVDPVSIMVTGDFDKDGNRDVATLSTNGHKVDIRFGDGAGGFRSAASGFTITSSNNTYTSMAAADLDGDGQAELIFPASASVFVYDWQANGSFAKTRTIDLTATGIDATKVAVGDLTSAGSRDIVVADDYGDKGVVWIANDGAGTFGTPTAYAAADGVGYYAQLLLADVDGDGLDDVVKLLSTASGVGVLLNKGDGTLNAQASYGITSVANFSTRSMVVADVDGDGHPDLVVTGYVHNASTFTDTFSLCVNLGNGGDGTFADGKSFAFVQNAGKNINANAIVAADLNGDGRPEIITTVDQPGTLTVDGFIGYIVTRWTGLGATLAVEGQDNFTIGDGIDYAALAVGDFNGDALSDVLLGTSSTIFGATQHSQFAVFLNTTPTLPALPTGRQVQFAQTALNITEGTELDVNVLRGTASTGQVVAYFSVSGTAVQAGAKVKSADYSITEPPQQSQAIVFAEGENRKNIHIVASAAKGAESAQTIILTLLPPIGDALLDTKTVTTVTIQDQQPASLAKAGALIVKPTNLVKPLPITLPKEVKVAGRTGSDWSFSVSRPLPADAQNAVVKVQYSFQPPAQDHWVDYLTLTHGKGTSWSRTNRHPFVCSKLYFRTFTHVDGYPDQFSAPTQPFAVIGGPELALNVSAISDSDGSGFTAHENEVITYHFSAANVSNDAASTPAVLTVPIPKHTTFLSATSRNVAFTQIKDKKGVTTAVVWNFASLPKTTFTEDLLVQIDTVGMFSASELKKHPNGFGTILTLQGQTLAAPNQGIKSGALLREKFETEILGPIQLSVSRPNAQDTVKGGDLITYTLTASNSSAVAATQVVVRDRIPLGTILDSLYVPDGTGNSTNTVLPNPSAASNPALVYILLQNAKFIGKKKGEEVDISILDADTLNKLVEGKLIAQEVKWPIGSIAANSQVQVKFTVRALYDLADPTVGSAPAQIVNDDYDFTIAGGISALYGNAPSTSGLSTAVTAAPPTTRPVVGLGKIAVGSHDLNNSIVHGDGYENIAGLGEITTAVQNHGFDFEILYVNSGDATAHHVVLHDVIPAGAQLLGFFKQSVNGSTLSDMVAEQFTYYDAAGNVMSNVTGSNITAVHSMDIRLSQFDNLTPLPASSYGVIRYSVQPTAAPAASGKPATFLHAYGGFDPKLRRSDPDQGAYITCADLQRVVPATPDETLIKVISAGTVKVDYTKGAFRSKPGDIVPFDFTATQDGDIGAANCHIDFTVPAGTTFLTTGPKAPAFTDATGGTLTTTLTGNQIRLTLGTIAAQTTRKLRFHLQVNSPLDAALVAKKFVFIEPAPTATGSPILPTFSAVHGRIALAAQVTTTTSTASGTQAVPVTPASAPTLSLVRMAPYTIGKGGTFTYTIAFANSGDTAATNVNVGMQIPYFTQFVSATNGIISAYNGTTSIPTPNLAPYTTTPRSAAQVKVTGPGPDIITWHFASLPAHSAGAIMLKVKVSNGFADDCVKDHSLYISADNAPSAVLAPNPIGTWVIGKPFDTSKWEVLGCFCAHLNIPINATTRPGLTSYVNELTRTTQVHAIARADGLQLGGISVLQLNNDQVLVIGPELIATGGGNLIATGGGNLIATGGGNLVAAGAGNAISLTGIASLGDHTASYLLDHAQSLIAAGAGNLIAAGAGNLISQDGAGFSQVSNHAGVASIAIAATNANLIATGGGNLIATGGGNLIATGGGNLITPNGGTLISQDGAGLLSNNTGTLVNVSSGNVISNDGASVVAAGAGN